MRVMLVAIGLAIAMSGAQAQSTPRADGIQQRAPADVVIQRPRPRVRIYREFDERDVYPKYNPGPNAVRECSARYVQEFRPSGTVITPRLDCYWRRS